MLRRIVVFECFRRRYGGRAFMNGGREPHEPLGASFLVGIDDVRAGFEHPSRHALADLDRILNQANLVLGGATDIRGHGRQAIRLTEGNWYDYESSELSLMMNRHDFLIPLCQASVLTGDRRYAADVERLFRHWCGHFSIDRLKAHDTPIDAAIRLLNWLWVFHSRTLEVEGDLGRRLRKIIYLQLEYVRTWSSAGGNHLVLEALASFVYGVVFRGAGCARRWYRWGYATLTTEILRQVASDGVHSEQSTFYHHVVATHFLKAYLTAQRNRIQLPDAYAARLRQMIRVVHDTMRPDLGHPALGDGEPLDGADREHWESKVLLAAGAVLFGDPVFEPFRQTLNDTCLWFVGSPASGVVTSAHPPPSRVFPATGLAVLRGADTYLLFDAAPFGDPHFPHHGHADALSVEFALGGRPLVVDPCGYGYYDDPYRRYFRSTRAHNTIRLDRTDQSQVFGILGYGRLATVRLEDWELGPGIEKVTATHAGYHPTLHRREIYHHAEHRPFFLLVDWLMGEGLHEVEALYHLAPGTDVDIDDRLLRTEQDGAFAWDFACDPRLRPSRVFGSETGEIQGWYSPATRELLPTAVLMLSGRVELPLVLATVFWATEEPGTLEMNPQRLSLQTDGFRVELALDHARGRSRPSAADCDARSSRSDQ